MNSASAPTDRVAGIHVEGAAPPAMLTSPCSRPSAQAHRVEDRGDPGMVAASAATGTIGSPPSTSGPTCGSRLSCERLTATTVAPTRPPSRVTVVRCRRPPAPDTTTMRPSSLAIRHDPLSFAGGLVRTNSWTLLTGEHHSAAVIAPSRGAVSSYRFWKARQRWGHQADQRGVDHPPCG